jgi:hypothetical protein
MTINKYILLTGGLLLLTLLVKAKKVTTKMFSKFPSNLQLKLNLLNDSLTFAGVPDDKRKFLISQLLFETGAFTKKSKVAELNNNFSGIKWLNKPYQLASKGSEVPISERVNPYPQASLNYYAYFKTYNDWAIDYKRILSTFGAKPIEATSLLDYVTRLGKNKYFDITKPNATKNYYLGMKSYYDKIQ